MSTQLIKSCGLPVYVLTYDDCEPMIFSSLEKLQEHEMYSMFKGVDVAQYINQDATVNILFVKPGQVINIHEKEYEREYFVSVGDFKTDLDKKNRIMLEWPIVFCFTYEELVNNYVVGICYSSIGTYWYFCNNIEYEEDWDAEEKENKEADDQYENKGEVLPFQLSSTFGKYVEDVLQTAYKIDCAKRGISYDNVIEITDEIFTISFEKFVDVSSMEVAVTFGDNLDSFFFKPKEIKNIGKIRDQFIKEYISDLTNSRSIESEDLNKLFHSGLIYYHAAKQHLFCYTLQELNSKALKLKEKYDEYMKANFDEDTKTEPSNVSVESKTESKIQIEETKSKPLETEFPKTESKIQIEKSQHDLIMECLELGHKIDKSKYNHHGNHHDGKITYDVLKYSSWSKFRNSFESFCFKGQEKEDLLSILHDELTDDRNPCSLSDCPGSYYYLAVWQYLLKWDKSKIVEKIEEMIKVDTVTFGDMDSLSAKLPVSIVPLVPLVPLVNKTQEELITECIKLAHKIDENKYDHDGKHYDGKIDYNLLKYSPYFNITFRKSFESFLFKDGERMELFGLIYNQLADDEDGISFENCPSSYYYLAVWQYLLKLDKSKIVEKMEEMKKLLPT